MNRNTEHTPEEAYAQELSPSALGVYHPPDMGRYPPTQNLSKPH